MSSCAGHLRHLFQRLPWRHVEFLTSPGATVDLRRQKCAVCVKGSLCVDVSLFVILTSTLTQSLVLSQGSILLPTAMTAFNLFQQTSLNTKFIHVHVRTGAMQLHAMCLIHVARCQAWQCKVSQRLTQRFCMNITKPSCMRRRAHTTPFKKTR